MKLKTFMRSSKVFRMPKKIDTHASRTAIGFPSVEEWAHSPAVFTEHSLKIAGHPVMEDWEKGYMEKLAEITTRHGGRVLELGYGMGISARAIQLRDIDTHHIVEFHPDVVAKAVSDLHIPIEKGRVHLHSGLWEDITPLLRDESFDGILFDTYPLTEKEIHSNHFWFFNEAYRLLRPGGVLTYYSDEATDISPEHMNKLVETGFNREKIDFVVCDVNPPADCEYWQDPTIIAPIITK